MCRAGFRVFAAVVCLAAAQSLGQTLDKAQLSGVVRDQSGGVVAGAELLLRRADTGQQRRTFSSATGTFLFPFLVPGAYSLQTKAPGFATVDLRGIRLSANQSLDLPLNLEIAAITGSLTVEANPSAVETTSPSLRHLIPESQIGELPVVTDITVNGGDRNVIDSLTALTAGATFQPSSSAFQNSARVKQVAINGTPPGALGFSLDGIDNKGHGETNLQGPRSLGPNPDVVSEFSVLTHTFTAEAGSDPVIVSVETKRGGNQFHGQARFLFLHPKMAARDFFDRFGTPRTSTTVFGGQVSGPLVLPHIYDGHDRTFFLFDIESYRNRVTETQFVTVPSEAERQGDFSALPEGLWPLDPETEEVFPGGVIPPERISPQANYYVGHFIPPSNSADNELVLEGATISDALQSTTRVDHQITASDVVSATLFFRNGALDFPTIFATLGYTALKVDDPSQTFALHYTRSLSPTTANSLNFGLSRGFRDQSEFGIEDETDPASLGFNLSPATDGPWTLPNISISELGRISVGRTQSRWKSATWNLKDTASILRATHSLKLGFDVRWLRQKSLGTDFFGSPAYNFSSFNSDGSGIGFADLLLGIPSSFYQGEEEISEPRRTLSSFFVQDDIRLTSNLTVNLGLRYDLYGPMRLASGRNGAFRPEQQSEVFPEAPTGILYAGDFDLATGRFLTDSITSPDRNNWSPRVGLAFSPSVGSGFWGWLFGGSRKTSLRFGYGIYTIQNDPSWFQSGQYLPPFGFSVYRDSSQIRHAGGSFADPWGSDGDLFEVPKDQRGFPDRISTSTIDPNLRDPYQHQWTVSWQRQLGNAIVLETAYVGSAGRNLLRVQELNPGLLTEDASPRNVNQRRAYQSFGGVQGFFSDGRSSYHGLQVMATRRYSTRLQFNLNYTWSKTLSDADGTFEFADRDIDGWARADIDQRHRFAGTFLWEIPVSARGDKLRRLVEGWQVSGVVRLATGVPINLRNAVDSTLRGVSPGTPDLIGPFRYVDPRQVQTFQLPDGGATTGNFYFDPTVIAAVSEARPGTLGRNTFNGPGIENIDLSLGKVFALAESQDLVFRVDVRNLLNQAQFSLPRTQYATRGGRQQPGRITSTYGARTIQFYLRYQF